jgi:magnesium chelatase subunit H
MSRSLRFVNITMDGGQNAAWLEAAQLLQADYGVKVHLSLHSTATLGSPESWTRLERDIAQADFVMGSMIFGEEYVRPLVRLIEQTDTPRVFVTSNPAVIYCTSLGTLDLKPPDEDEEPGLLKRWMQKLRPKKKDGKSEGYRQTALIKNVTRLMKYLPGKMRDLHTFIVMHDYLMHSSPENIKRQMCLLIDRYVPDYSGVLPVEEPIAYPEAAFYHPDAPHPFPTIDEYKAWRRQTGRPVDAWDGHAGLLTMRAIILSENTNHLDALIRSIEAQGIEARATYSALLDFRPAIADFMSGGELPKVDVLLNTMGFPLVGGPAGARPEQAVESLAALDVGYLDMIPLGFQRIEDWQADDMGLNPMQAAMNIALPELDGSAEPVIYGGPTQDAAKFAALDTEIALTAQRVARRVRLHRKPNAQKKIALVLFNFPPTLGNIGSAAFLDVFDSVYRLLQEMDAVGYTVDLPESADALRRSLTEGNANQYGTDGNVLTRLSLDEYRANFPWYVEIEENWGYAPGELLTDGSNFYILGVQSGNVFIGIQPSFGYERDPMRLLMGKDATPHHGFAAFYTWLNHSYDADAVLHVGTHGALEFMPGKQVGVSANDWPARLLGELPNVYYYCVNNPSEGAIAKRRSAATLVSYMVPPMQQAGLYKGLRRLKDSIDTYRKRPDEALLTDIHTQADQLGITVPDADSPSDYIGALGYELVQVEHRMIPLGLHRLGQPPTDDELVDMLALTAALNRADHPEADEKLPTLTTLIANGLGLDYKHIQRTMKTNSLTQSQYEQIDGILRGAIRQFVSAPSDTDALDTYLADAANIPAGLLVNLWAWLADVLNRILNDREVEGLLHALDAGYIEPSPGNDVIRNDAIVPTGRNIHALDPYRVPSSVAIDAARGIMDAMLARLTAQNGSLPETVAMVLWGTDNLKSDGEGIAQCFWLLGAEPVEDELGNIADVRLLPLATLGRPRIDIVMTLSGIFRDLFHHQAGLLDKAVRLAAHADEPTEQNFVRAHALAHAAELDISLDEAAARVYSNAPGAYGANVNRIVDSSNWESDQELSDMFLARKSYAYQPGGTWAGSKQVMQRTLSTVDAAFQNIDSFELGISDVDHYYEYLGGVTKSVEKLRGKRPSVMVADAIAAADDRLTSLEQMVRIESRAKMLNPRWYEAMLDHGYEGVREIEARVSNTYGWSATADAVEKWVYDDVAETFILDEAMRNRMATANPHATAGIARRLLEAESRGFWEADENTLDELRDIYGNLEDQLEGVGV